MTNKNSNLEEFKQSATYHFSILKPGVSIYDGCSREIKMSIEMIHNDNIKNTDFDIRAVLKLALQMFPRAELELLNEIQKFLLNSIAKVIKVQLT